MATLSAKEIAELKSKVRGRIRDKYASGTEVPKKVIVKEPDPVFLEVGGEEGDSEVKADAIMYSDKFPGAKPWLDKHKKPDLDISSLVYDTEQWDTDAQLQIPTLDEDYVWQHDILYPLVLSHLTGLKVLTVGPTGSGKTTLHQNLAAVYNQPFYRLSGRGDMESDTILGRVDIEDGTTSFLPGEFTKAFAGGFYCLLDEIWKLPSNINMALQRPLERGGILQIDDMKGDLKDKQFAPAPTTIIALADNVVGTGDNMDKYSATMIQDGSTLNRVDLILYMDYLNPKEEEHLLLTKYKFLPKGQAKRAVQLANLIRTGYEKDQVSVGMSPRNLTAWMELAYQTKSYKEAFKWVMLRRFAEEDERATVANYWNTVYGEQL